MSLRQTMPARHWSRRPPQADDPHRHWRPGRHLPLMGVFTARAVVFLLVQAMAAQSQAPAAGQAPKKAAYPATIAISCDLACRWTLDGKLRGEIDEGKTATAGLPLGRHQVKAQTLDGLDQFEKQIDITEKGETAVRFELEPLRDTRVNLEQQANSARPAEQAYEDGQMMNAQQQFDRARPLFEQACNGGHANACASLGYLYDAGKGGVQDYQRASVAYQKACAGGIASSCTSLGILYEYGHGVTQDYGQARTYYEKGCGGRYATGCSYLGDLYRTGHGVPKDIAHGRQLLQKGCDLGDEWGCNELKKP